jgi:hypothetical protein
MDGVIAGPPEQGLRTEVESLPHRKLAEHPAQHKERHRIDTVWRETFSIRSGIGEMHRLGSMWHRCHIPRRTA